MRAAKLRSVADIIQFLNERAPLGVAEEWDNVGLLAGNPSEKTEGAVVSIDLTEEAVDLAIRKKFKLIINHHPCIFPKGKGLSRILAGTPLFKALQNGISVASYHTNFDKCALEVVASVSQGLGLESKGRLFDQSSTELTKWVAFGPKGHAAKQVPDSEGIIFGMGYGFWGEFPSPRPFSDFAKSVKRLFNIHGFWITDPAPSRVTRVGFVAGKGSSFVKAASEVGCDLLITGEAGYHAALDGRRRGVAVMELGHRESEKFFIETMTNWLTHLRIGFVKAETPTQKIWLGGTL